MTWLDLLLALLFAVFVALGAERRLSGLLLGVGGVLLLRPLLLIGEVSPVLSVAVALLAGLVISLLARRLGRRRRLQSGRYALLGGIGGALLGAVLVLSTAVSMPIERNSLGQIIYPPQQLPGAVGDAVAGSRVLREGRDILLYPLLERQGDIGPRRSQVVRLLHSYLVVGQPWEGR
ncbi:MAG TPA: hypothetical protein VF168_03075 [Trueperaceae bacterium]